MKKQAKTCREAKSLYWLANMWPEIEHPKDETDRMCNCIHDYCVNGADLIESLLSCIDALYNRLMLRDDLNPIDLLACQDAANILGRTESRKDD